MGATPPGALLAIGIAAPPTASVHSSSQHASTRACQSAGSSVTRPKGIAVPCQQLVVLLRGLVNTQPHPTTPG